jgi:Golgi apparatus protein 1
LQLQVRLAQNIDFKFPMKKAHTEEIQELCTDVAHGQALVIACLQVKLFNSLI